VRYTDLGPLRALRIDALRDLAVREMGHGWPVAMQVGAARSGLRVREVPIAWRRRGGGRSKVSGTVSGTVRAGLTILRIVLWSA
jgi:hypothetical protein